MSPAAEDGSSVDFATGLEQHVMADIGIDGARGGIGIVRMYRTVNPNIGPFGIGTAHNYHYQISVTSLTAATFNFIHRMETSFRSRARRTALTSTRPIRRWSARSSAP